MKVPILGVSLGYELNIDAEFDKLVKRVEDAGRYCVKVGYPKSMKKRKDGKKPTGMTNAQLAYWHEFGTKRAPARPFLRPAVKQLDSSSLASKMAFRALKDGLRQKIRTGEDEELRHGFAHLGVMVQTNARQNIVEQRGFKPLSRYTLKARERRGFQGTKALIETGQLVDAITWTIEKGGKRQKNPGDDEDWM